MAPRPRRRGYPVAALPAARVWARELRDHLGELSRDERRALQLVYFEGQTDNDIADRLGTSPDLVAAHRASALRALSERLLAADAATRVALSPSD